MTDQVRAGGENPDVQGMQGDQKAQEQFGDRDLSLASEVSPDGLQRQSNTRGPGAFVSGTSIENRAADVAEPASAQKVPEAKKRFGELKCATFPDKFVLHPSRRDELYFEAQRATSSTCGIHALNHFTGKPIFGIKETEGAHILYECFVEAPDLIAKLRSIQGNLLLMRSQLQNNGQENLSRSQLDNLKQVENSIDQKLAKLDRAIAAVTTMGKEGDGLLENNPLARYADLIGDVSDLGDISNLGDPSVVRACGDKLNGQGRSEFERCKKSIEDVSEQLKKSLSPRGGLDLVALRIAMEKQAEVVLHAESGPGREITNGLPADASQEKKDLLEALKRDKLPNNADRAIIDTGSCFKCVRKLANGQWVLLDSYRGGPTTLPAGGLAKLLADCPSYQIMYCQSEADQQKLEAFIAATPGRFQEASENPHPARPGRLEVGKPPAEAVASRSAQRAPEARKRSGELKSAISPNKFILHPSHANELHFETQRALSNTCGIHALNHFTGKPIFGVKETEGAHILYRCFTEAPGLVAKLRSIRSNLLSIQSQLQNDRQAVDSINQKLAELNRAIAAVIAMGKEGDGLLENNPLVRYANFIRDISDLGDPSVGLSCKRKLNGQARSKFERCKKSLIDVSKELQKSLSPLDGLDPVALMIALENQAKVVLQAESGPGREITRGPRAGTSQGKKDLLEALKRDELPNGVDRAIIDDGSHFRCVRRLADGRWTLLDSYRGEPIILSKGGLAKLLADCPSYQIMYCRSAEDQRRLENFIANAQ
ncbi:MAG: hypothetical protein LBC30_03730 [Puniceicoccales bacterium]|jgi:hypothetical protein|nr:hypothetical protein [Puniceicoccales bacterium]